MYPISTYRYADPAPLPMRRGGIPPICVAVPVALLGLFLLPFLFLSGHLPGFPGMGHRGGRWGQNSCPHGSPPPKPGPYDKYQINGKAYPKHWDNLPDVQTADYVELPLDYGMGSSSVKTWMEQKIQEDAGKMIYYSPNGKMFPHWGKPPPYHMPGESLTELPFDLGAAGQAFRAWVIEHINEDRYRGGWFYSPNFIQYPKQWGEPPVPYPPLTFHTNHNWLPLHLGKGPCDLAQWIVDGYTKFPRKPEQGVFQDVFGNIYHSQPVR